MTRVHNPHTPADTFNAGIFAEEDDREERERREEQKALILGEALSAVMSTESGRRSMAWLLELTGVDESVTASNDRAMLYASAQRDIGLEIRHRLLSACPSYFELMEKESDERRRNDN